MRRVFGTVVNHVSIAESLDLNLRVCYANFSKAKDFGRKGQAHNWPFDRTECVSIHKSNKVQIISLLLLPHTLGQIFCNNKSIVEIKNFRIHF